MHPSINVLLPVYLPWLVYSWVVAGVSSEWLNGLCGCVAVDGLGVNQALHSQLQEWPSPLLVPGPLATIDLCTLPHLHSYNNTANLVW